MQGDSGGPMNFRNTDGSWTAIGIVSFGSGDGCTIRYADVFTRVSFYLNWIDSHVGRKKLSTSTLTDQTPSATNKPTTSKAYTRNQANDFSISFSLIIIPVFVSVRFLIQYM